MLGSNYVVVEVAVGKSLRKWLDAVEKIEESCGGGMDAGAMEVPEPDGDVTKTRKKKKKDQAEPDIAEKTTGKDAKRAKYHVKQFKMFDTK